MVKDASMIVISSDTFNRCNVTNCTLQDATDCEAEYIGKFVSMNETAPWPITAKSSVDFGYVEQVCIKCTNNKTAVSTQVINVTQNVNCKTQWDAGLPISVS